MLNIAVCDDDKFICSEIENIIIEYAKETKTAIETEVFYSGEDLYGYMQKDSRIDLIFMDIELSHYGNQRSGEVLKISLTRTSKHT